MPTAGLSTPFRPGTQVNRGTLPLALCHSLAYPVTPMSPEPYHRTSEREPTSEERERPPAVPILVRPSLQHRLDVHDRRSVDRLERPDAQAVPPDHTHGDRISLSGATLESRTTDGCTSSQASGAGAPSAPCLGALPRDRSTKRMRQPTFQRPSSRSDRSKPGSRTGRSGASLPRRHGRTSYPHARVAPASTSAASFSSDIRQPASLSGGERPRGSPSCTAMTSVPPSPSASASVIVIVISPRSAGSATRRFGDHDEEGTGERVRRRRSEALRRPLERPGTSCMRRSICPSRPSSCSFTSIRKIGRRLFRFRFELPTRRSRSSRWTAFL